MARKQALAQARGGIRALGPLALASLKAQRCALKRVQSRERAPAFARTTAGVSGQCGGILSSDGGLPGAFEPLVLAALKAQRCVVKQCQEEDSLSLSRRPSRVPAGPRTMPPAARLPLPPAQPANGHTATRVPRGIRSLAAKISEAVHSARRQTMPVAG